MIALKLLTILLAGTADSYVIQRLPSQRSFVRTSPSSNGSSGYGSVNSISSSSRSRCNDGIGSGSSDRDSNRRAISLLRSIGGGRGRRRRSTLHSTDFSTFADSLESDFFEDDEDEGKDNNKDWTEKDRRSSSNKIYDNNNLEEEKSWQSKLDELVDPSTNLADRQILLSELITSNDKIRDSVFDALTNRKIDPLLTPTQKKLQDGTRAVVRQLANDILPQIAASTTTTDTGDDSGTSSSFGSTGTGSGRRRRRRRTPVSAKVVVPNMETIGTRLFSAVTNQIQKNIEELQEDLTDPINKIPKRLEKQRDEVLKEARNVFLEKPEGLEEPPYTVVDGADYIVDGSSSNSGSSSEAAATSSSYHYEIRSYDAYTVASTKMSTLDDNDDDDDELYDGMMMEDAGSAFNTLASYIFGENDESKVMSMTTPVTTTSSGDMRFYISPTDGIDDDGRVPRPSSSSSSNNNKRKGVNGAVEIVEIPSSTLAVRKFTGFVTDGEVARQKDTLLQSLDMDGIELDVPHGAVVPHVVFQYNPPYTLPIFRCNEIGVPVRLITNEKKNIKKKNDDDDDTISVSSASLKKEWTVEEDDNEDQ